MISNCSIANYLTIDVEDYFQVSAFENAVDAGQWSLFECRVEQNTRKILDLCIKHEIHATFFVTGWIAERYPGLVCEIDQNGHEIGCHSYWHRRVYELTPEEFRDDTRRTKDILEDIISKPVLGYRAPSYSITGKSLWALDILKELGFTYDSSIFPVFHDTYGIPNAPRFEYRLERQDMMEYPLSTLRVTGYNLPIAGGGYFRLFPYWFTRAALTRINRSEQKPFIFYLHPWELDPNQPRIANISWKSRFRHYNNLYKTEARLERLLGDFSFIPIEAGMGKKGGG